MRLLGFVVGVLVPQLLACVGTAPAADFNRQVLLLYAESRLAPALVAADTAFRSTVSSSFGVAVDVRTEFLDLPPTPSVRSPVSARDRARPTCRSRFAKTR